MRVKLKKIPLSGQRRVKLAGTMLIVMLVGGLGVYLLGGSHAASPFGAINADEGSVTAPAQTITDSLASDGKGVQFGTASVTQTPLPSPGTWTNVTNNLAGTASQCGNLTILSAVPNSNGIIAGVAGVGMYESTNDGASWSQLGTGSGSDVITNRPSSISYDPTNPQTFWESGIYGNNYGVYKTTDGGNTFHHLGSSPHDDYVSIDFTDPNRQTLLAGGHETAQRIDKSTDGGNTWTNIWPSLSASIGGSFTTDPIVINAQTYIVNAYVGYNGGNPGIYRTTDGGNTWTKVSSQGPEGTPLITSNGTIYWSDGSSLVKSTDSGVTWTQVGSNLYGSAFSFMTPIQLPDGRLVTLNANATSLMVSADGGSTWTPFGAALPTSLTFSGTSNSSSGIIYSPSNKAFFIGQWDCGNVVLPNAIARLQ